MEKFHDPFLTPFTNGVLENVGVREVYSFTYGFSGHHHMCIEMEDILKTTFTIEWGSFSYTIIPFSLKNPLVIFSRIVVASFK